MDYPSLGSYVTHLPMWGSHYKLLPPPQTHSEYWMCLAECAVSQAGSFARTPWCLIPEVQGLGRFFRALTSHNSLPICRGMQGGGCGTTAFRRGMPFSSSSQSPTDEASPKFQRPYFGSGLEGPTTTCLSSLLETRVTWPAPGRCHWRVSTLNLIHICNLQRILSFLGHLFSIRPFYPSRCTKLQLAPG